MLALTTTAAEVVNAIVSQDRLPDTAGVRITSEEAEARLNGASPPRDVRLSVVHEPEAGDEVVDGVPVFVEPGPTADLLDDKVLDADISGEQVEFQLFGQDE
jgi:hypothetical protein